MFFQQVLNYGFLYIFLRSFIQACPTIMQDGWKQSPIAERTRRADVVAIGKALEVYTDPSLPSKKFKTGGFHLTQILKGHEIINKIYANKSHSRFYILGFGSPTLCYTRIVKDETYLLFVKFIPATLTLHVPFDTPFAGTADPTIENQDKVLASQGWEPWSDWSSCSVSCSGGWESRTRTCRTGNCKGSTTWRRTCNSYECDGVTNVLKPFQLRRNTRSIPPPPQHRNALQINNLGNLSVPTHQIFWHKFPQNFTMFAAAKYVNYTGGYLISFYDSRDRLQIGIKVSKTSVALEYARDGKKNKYLAFNVEVMDRKWHRFAFSVGNGLVSFYLDCQMIGTQNITEANLTNVDRNGNAYLNAKAELSEERNRSMKFYIEELSLSEDVRAGQEQCEFNNPYKEKEPLESEGSGEELEYTWSSWTSCSETCGTNGVRRRVKLCTSASWMRLRKECQDILQHSEEEACNIKPCPGKCHERCVHGVCTARNKCKCKRNYYGVNCQNRKVLVSPCKRSCGNGGRCYRGICKCTSGFTGKYCERAACFPSCQPGGVCMPQGVCTCRPGYIRPHCKPACLPSCMNNGLCISPNKCHCRQGFAGKRCQNAVCKKACLNGGVCYDNNKCNCKSGWTGDTCNIAICHPKCQNGGVCRLPNRCSCPNKTSGTHCQHVEFECTSGCLNGGRCSRDNTCLCSHKYSGARCEMPVCRPNCQNGGKCVAPNQCICPSGFFGNLCERRSCIYKTRVVPRKRTEHIPIATSLPKWCTHHQGWRPCTERKIEYRTVHITTYRTIYYCD